MNKSLIKLIRCENISTCIRHASSSRDGGIKYFGFTYFPRFPGKPDPPCEPSKLLMVRRIKPVKGNPYWEKKLLKEFRLDGKDSQVSIVKNIPEINGRLWKIKHLVEITPVTFPHGEPSLADAGGTFLKENGEMLVSQRINVAPERLEASAKVDANVVDGETLRKQLRLKWINPW